MSLSDAVLFLAYPHVVTPPRLCVVSAEHAGNKQGKEIENAPNG